MPFYRPFTVIILEISFFKSGVQVYQALGYLGHWCKKIPKKTEQEGNKRNNLTNRQQESQASLVPSSLLCYGSLLILSQIKQYLLPEAFSALPIGINPSSGKPQSIPTTVNLLSQPLLSQLVLYLN